MPEQTMSEETLAAIREESSEDPVASEFIMELTFEEAEHSSQHWHYKAFYGRKIEEHATRWDTNNENH